MKPRGNMEYWLKNRRSLRGARIETHMAEQNNNHHPVAPSGERGLKPGRVEPLPGVFCRSLRGARIETQRVVMARVTASVAPSGERGLKLTVGGD